MNHDERIKVLSAQVHRLEKQSQDCEDDPVTARENSVEIRYLCDTISSHETDKMRLEEYRTERQGGVLALCELLPDGIMKRISIQPDEEDLRMARMHEEEKNPTKSFIMVRIIPNDD